MKQVVLREMRKDEIVFLSVFVFLAFVAFECFPLYELLSNWHAADTRLPNLLMSLGITLLFLILTLMLVHRSRKKICITEDSVTWVYGRKVLKTVPKDQIVAYGVFSQREKDMPGFPFFCFATVDEIAAIGQKYWHWRKRIYTKKQLEELEKTPEGIWPLQVSIYIYRGQYRLFWNRNYLSVSRVTKDELHSMGEIWQRTPMLIGTMSLHFPWRYQ